MKITWLHKFFGLFFIPAKSAQQPILTVLPSTPYNFHARAHMTLSCTSRNSNGVSKNQMPSTPKVDKFGCSRLGQERISARKRRECEALAYAVLQVVEFFKWGVQNWKDFCLKINIPKGNYWILSIGVMARSQKSGIILENKVI